MAALGMRPWCLFIFVLSITSTHTQAKEVTHEDLRDVLVPLVQSFRATEMKLDRHEAREKALGDQLKKMLISLDRKHKLLEPLDGLIRRLDSRLSNVETIFLQKDEKEKATQQKTTEMLIDIQKSILALTAAVNDNSKKTVPSESNLTTEVDSLSRRLVATDARLEAVRQEIKNFRDSFNKEALRAVCLEMVTDVNPFERHISEAEKLLNKYELKLNEYNETSSKVPTDFVPLSEVALADEAWHNKMTEVMERQEGDIMKIQQSLSSAESMWKELPRLSDLNRATNHTLEALAAAQHNLTRSHGDAVDLITTKLREMRDRFATTNQDTQQSLTQSNILSEQAYQTYNEILNNLDNLKNEISTIKKIEADDLVAVKKRIEYGVNRIIGELTQNINSKEKLLKEDMKDNLHEIGKAILDNQRLTISNLTAQIDADLSPVWGQIGNIFQKLIAVKTVLDDHVVQSEQYYNGTANNVDGVNAKVDGIKKHVDELTKNLNGILGDMFVEAQEFNRLRANLQETLDKAKTNDLPAKDTVEGNRTDPKQNKQ